MKKGNNIWLIFIVIFILAGLAFDPLKQNASKLGRSGGSQFGSSISNPNNDKSPEEDIKSAEAEVVRLQKELEKRQEESTRSPYYQKIGVDFINGLNDPDPDQEFITLYTYLEKGETVNITGWFLKSSVTGNFVKIGKATLLPFPYSKADSDIVLKQNDRVILTKGFSPIGISFRTNKCTGYFEENRTFYPPLYQVCPDAKDEKLPRFSSIEDRNDECLDIIERLPRCETVNQQYLRDLPDTVPSTCKNYMQTQINYNTCVANHFDDTDFPGNEYRVYFNRFGELWRTRHDTIILYDREGLIVGKIEY